MITIGHIDFVNMIPFDFEGAAPYPYKKITGPPTQINRMLLNHEVDVGVISLAYYLEHRDKLVRLGHYGILSNGPVMSVVLFSKQNLSNGHSNGGLKVYETSQSATSVILNRIILEEVYKTKIVPVPTVEEADAALLIGNQALMERQQKGWNYLYDLGAEWKRLTGLPAVFAVLATNLTVFEKNKTELNLFLEFFGKTYRKNTLNMNLIVKKAQEKIPLEENVLYQYFRCLEYEIGVDEEQSIVLFDQLRRR